ncbi:SDR family NAD(P)-dependent oxidoreductase, partial [Pseudoalteromonas sp. SMN1298-MNA-CIBAN-0114]
SNFGEFHHCDVSDVTVVRRCINAIVEQTQRIDVLVSNAGKHLSANIESTDEQTLDALFALNVKGAYAAVQSVLPIMKTQNNGAIVL